jgi:hypothetical protein
VLLVGQPGQAKTLFFKKITQTHLDKIDGITARSFTKGTNSINASAEWEESEISGKIEQIQNIGHVITLNYNKRVKRNTLEPKVGFGYCFLYHCKGSTRRN